MDGVTDHPYRYIQKKYGKPEVVYTEFTSVEGVCHGATKLLQDFLYDETQRPIMAQIYGTTPGYFRQTAILLCHLGFDGIDINMGCPAKNVAHSGAGAALIQTPDLATEIISQTKQGIADWHNGALPTDCADISVEIATEVSRRHELLPETYRSRSRQIPVSIKTRIGFSTPVVSDWIPTLLAQEPAAIALHGRTLKQQYSGEAHWEEIAKAALLARETNTLLLGNGDVSSKQDALKKSQTYGTDGALIGRASFGNPFVFLDSPREEPSIFSIALEHAQYYENSYSKSIHYSFLPMRKHLGWYVRSIPHAREVRIKLFQSNSSAEVATILRDAGLLKD